MASQPEAALTLAALAQRFDLECPRGTGDTPISGVCALTPGRAGCIAFAEGAANSQALAESAAAAVIVPESLVDASVLPVLKKAKNDKEYVRN